MSRRGIVHNIVPMAFLCCVLLVALSLVVTGEPTNRRPPDLLGRWFGFYQLQGTDSRGQLFSRIDEQVNRRFIGVMGFEASASFNAINFNMAGTLAGDQA